jgi:transposase
MSRSRKYAEEVVQRGVRLGLERDRPIAQIAADLGMHPETLRKRVRHAEADSGARFALLSSLEREEIRRLRRENLRAAPDERDPESAALLCPRSSTKTDRSYPLHRRAQRPLRGRADLPHPGRVGVRLLPAPEGMSAPRDRLRMSAWSACPASCTRRTTTLTVNGGCGRRRGVPASVLLAAGCSS